MNLVTLQAAAVLADAPASVSANVNIDAYSGGMMTVPRIGPCVIVLAGLELPASVPLICHHQNAVEAVVGFGMPTLLSASLAVQGQLTAETDAGRQVTAMAREGFPWQASVGVEILEEDFIAPGQSFQANGQTFVAPAQGATLIHRGRLREVSLCVMGCDPKTSVTLAAALAKNAFMTKSAPTAPATDTTNSPPDFTAWVKSLGFDPATLDEGQTRSLKELFKTTIAVSETGVDPGDSPKVSASYSNPAHSRNQNDAARQYMQHLEANAPTWASSRGNGDGGPNHSNVLEASLSLEAGVSANRLAKFYGQHTVDAAMSKAHRGATFRTAAEFVIRQAGQPVRENRITDSFIRAAFDADRMLRASGLSTVSLSGLLGNVAGKVLLDAYQSTPTTWQNFCATTTAKDFKPYKRFRLIGKGKFQEVAKGGEIKSISLEDQEYEGQLSTFGAMVAVDRQDMINDDLGALEQLPRVLGRLSAMRLEKEIYTLLLSNPDNFFHLNNDNIETGGGSVLSVAGLTAAELRFLERLDPNGDPLLVLPKILLVPPALSVTSNSLTRDTQVVAIGVGDTAETTPSGNPHAGRFRPVVSPWMSNENVAGHSKKKWILAAEPTEGVAMMDVGFLNGQTTPTIESGELDFNQLGMWWRGVFDFGVAMQDHRAALMSVGE